MKLGKVHTGNWRLRRYLIIDVSLLGHSEAPGVNFIKRASSTRVVSYPSVNSKLWNKLCIPNDGILSIYERERSNDIWTIDDRTVTT